eukprot:IDg3051t1
MFEMCSTRVTAGDCRFEVAMRHGVGMSYVDARSRREGRARSGGRATNVLVLQRLQLTRDVDYEEQRKGKEWKPRNNCCLLEKG